MIQNAKPQSWLDRSPGVCLIDHGLACMLSVHGMQKGRQQCSSTLTEPCARPTVPGLWGPCLGRGLEVI